MTFYLYDCNEYLGYIYFTTKDYENEFCADVDGCYSEDTEEWDDDKVREIAEKQLEEQYGSDAKIEWQYI